MSKVAGFTMLMGQIIAQQGYPAGYMGTYLQPMVQGCGCHREFTLFPQYSTAA